MKRFIALLCLCLAATAAQAGAPEILDATVTKQGMNWRVAVTLRHNDTGWDHYADGWEVQDESGKVLGYRELLHPHVEEQPFTRSLSNLVVPDGTRKIYIRARCSVDGWAGDRFEVELSP